MFVIDAALFTFLLCICSNQSAPAKLHAAEEAARGTAESCTASGLKYSILAPPVRDATHPGLTDCVWVHFTATLENGTVFQTSRVDGIPYKLRLGALIAGLNEGLQLMTPGARFRFVIPPSLSYGSLGRPGVPPNATLYYDVEMLQVIPGRGIPEFVPVEAASARRTSAGLQYLILNPGSGMPPKPDSLVILHYTHWTHQGQLRDCSAFVEAVKTTPREFLHSCLREVVLLMPPQAVFLVDVPNEDHSRTESSGIWRLESITPRIGDFKDDAWLTKGHLKYVVHREGSGMTPTTNEPVGVHFSGWRLTGELVDSTIGGDTFTCSVGTLIPGLNQGLQMMKEGSIYSFLIPPELAYGEHGRGRRIPPGAELIFTVELVHVGLEEWKE